MKTGSKELLQFTRRLQCRSATRRLRLKVDNIKKYTFSADRIWALLSLTANLKCEKRRQKVEDGETAVPAVLTTVTLVMTQTV